MVETDQQVVDQRIIKQVLQVVQAVAPVLMVIMRFPVAQEHQDKETLVVEMLRAPKTVEQAAAVVPVVLVLAVAVLEGLVDRVLAEQVWRVQSQVLHLHTLVVAAVVLLEVHLLLVQ